MSIEDGPEQVDEDLTASLDDDRELDDDGPDEGDPVESAEERAQHEGIDEQRRVSRIRRRAVVHGSVQGVGFRWAARAEADRLGVAGHARNRFDGTVEAEVEGDRRSVQAMLDWLAQGPPSARVERVEESDLEPRDQAGFTIG